MSENVLPMFSSKNFMISSLLKMYLAALGLSLWLSGSSLPHAGSSLHCVGSFSRGTQDLVS